MLDKQKEIWYSYIANNGRRRPNAGHISASRKGPTKLTAETVRRETLPILDFEPKWPYLGWYRGSLACEISGGKLTVGEPDFQNQGYSVSCNLRSGNGVGYAAVVRPGLDEAQDVPGFTSPLILTGQGLSDSAGVQASRILNTVLERSLHEQADYYLPYEGGRIPAWEILAYGQDRSEPGQRWLFTFPYDVYQSWMSFINFRDEALSSRNRGIDGRASRDKQEARRLAGLPLAGVVQRIFAFLDDETQVGHLEAVCADLGIQHSAIRTLPEPAQIRRIVDGHHPDLVLVGFKHGELREPRQRRQLLLNLAIEKQLGLGLVAADPIDQTMAADLHPGVPVVCATDPDAMANFLRTQAGREFK